MGVGHEDLLARSLFTDFHQTNVWIRAGETVKFKLQGVASPPRKEEGLGYGINLYFNGITSAQAFSSGDALKVSLGDASIVYRYNEPALLTDFGGSFIGSSILDRMEELDGLAKQFSEQDSVGSILTIELLAGDGIELAGLELLDFSGQGPARLQAGASQVLIEEPYDLHSAAGPGDFLVMMILMGVVFLVFQFRTQKPLRPIL